MSLLTRMYEADDKWIQDVTGSEDFKAGALRKYFGLKDDEKITLSMLTKEIDRLQAEYPDGGYSDNDLKLFRRLNAAKNMMK
jgi:hypothetical protein